MLKLLEECKSYLFKRCIHCIVFLRSLKILFRLWMKLLCALFGASFSVRTATTKTLQSFLHDRWRAAIQISWVWRRSSLKPRYGHKYKYNSVELDNQLSHVEWRSRATLWSQIQIQLRWFGQSTKPCRVAVPSHLMVANTNTITHTSSTSYVE